MKKRVKWLIIVILIVSLIGSLIVFITPNKLAGRIFLVILKPDLESVSSYLLEYPEVSSIYCNFLNSSQGAFVLMMDDGTVRYSTGDLAMDKSISKILHSYRFGTIRADRNCVFFSLNKYSTQFSNALAGIQYAPTNRPITFADVPIKNEKIEDFWFYFSEQNDILG